MILKIIGWTTLMFSFIFISQTEAQQLDASLSLDSRVGYSTNTILNPFFGEWDRSDEGGFGLVSPAGHFFLNFDSFSVESVTAGFLEPFFTDRSTLYGGLGILNMRYRLSDRFTAGVETGGSHISTSFERNLVWAQPVVSWSPGLFTRVNLKAGSLYRSYRNLGDEGEQISNRFDLYALELETWPSFRWKTTAGLYGNLDRPTENISLSLGLERMFTSEFRVALRGGVDQFRVDVFTQQNGTGPGPGPGPGFPPGRGGPGGETEIIADSETDRIWRIGLDAGYQISRNITLTAGVNQLHYSSSVTEESVQDYQLSAGVRFSIRPFRNRSMRAEPEWSSNDTQSVIIRLNYRGDGELFMTGDFNNWEQPGIPLREQSQGRYIAQLSLEPGIYEYKILLIEGSEQTWIELSDDIHTTDDGFGGENGLIFIE